MKDQNGQLQFKINGHTMQQWIKKIVFFCLLCLSISSLFASPAGKERTIQAIQQQLLPMLKKYQVPGAAIVIYDHGYPYAFYYGTASLKQGNHVQSDTLFEIASVSKVFTSVLLAEEAQRGVVSLDKPMTWYIHQLPLENHNFSQVTLENLAAHVNGFGEMPAPTVHNRSQLLTSLKYWHPTYHAGTWWHYSNIGFGLLGYALTDATKLSYWDLLSRDILQPLNMKDTQLVGMPCTNKHCAQGYGWGGLAVQTTKQLQIIPAAGSVQASGDDMLKFMGAAMNLPGTPPRVASAMRLTETPVYKTSYGAQALGWEVHRLGEINQYGYLKNQPNFIGLKSCRVNEVSDEFHQDLLMFDKTGSVAGYRSYMVIVPSEKTGITVMLNRASSRTGLVTATRRALLMLVEDDNSQLFI
jgi:beta-lactamase class C